MIRVNINPNEKTSQTQNARILAHLQNGGQNYFAFCVRRFRLLAFICTHKDLRDRGYDIQSVFIAVPNGKKVKQHFMECAE